ncbi:MAG: glutamine-synthetase adenylyltransferase, partial [Alphaproteobacteria bacterium]|nr:glutamine-synthetase adenylyltransferase [Alphaproteobacteria bacterium]
MHEFDHLSSHLPSGADPERISLGLEKWSEAVDACGDPAVLAFAKRLNESPDGQRFLRSVFGNSPYLTICLCQDPHFTMQLLTRGWDAVHANILENLYNLRSNAGNTAEISQILRMAKRQAALTIAAADIAGAWTVQRVTEALSDFADHAISAAAAHVLREAAANDGLQLAHTDDPQKGSGLVILGMGKLGSRELNYSSDVDLIVLFDAEKIVVPDPDRILKIFVRLTRNLVKLLDERTRDGYVFRTDLRLRPDPASTPPALSVLAAELYYESLGQNWERAAMIKGRPVAGDLEAGAEFVRRLKPYIWRKHLDFAAIRDIHSIKRQIDAHRGGGEIAVAGHNVKLGRGGIREIEFFVQTQQLIWGGRQPELRTPGTLSALSGLAKAGHVEQTTADEMAASYCFLRRVEHHIQMINDEQTHTVPQAPKSLEGLAVFLGYAGTPEFSVDLEFHLRRVESHYAHLFEDAPDLTADGAGEGNLVFTGSEPDPQTLRTLKDMGVGSAE